VRSNPGATAGGARPRAVVGARAAELRLHEVQLAEHQPRVGGQHGVAPRSLVPVGEHEPGRRVVAVVRAHARHVEERVVPLDLVHRRQVREVPAAQLGGQLAAHDGVHDLPRVDELVGRGEQLDALEEEGPFLGEEDREALVDRDHAHVGFHLTEVGVDGGVQR
jgi:hypothetical protein